MFVRSYFDHFKYTAIILLIVLVECFIFAFVNYEYVSGIEKIELADLFDFSIIAVVIACTLWSKNNIDISSSLLLILFSHFVSVILIRFYDSGLEWMLGIYFFAAFSLYKCRFDKYIKVFAVMLTLSVSSELFWIVTNYQKSPNISWYWIAISVYFWLRKALTLRPIILYKCFNKSSNSIDLDHSLRVYCGIPIFIEFAMLMEYVLRHTLGAESLVIWNSYPYLIYGSNFLLIAVTLIKTYTSERKRQLLA